MNRLLRLFGTSIGRKLVVAATGILLVGFVLGHMLGNMSVYQGPDALNSYAAWLQGHPLLWVMRLGLLTAFAIHIYLALTLALENRHARPIQYGQREHVAVGISSRYIALTGLLVLAFVVYHILHFTLGAVQPEYFDALDGQRRHDVYSMVVHGFQNPIVSSSYVFAMIVLGFHLHHGTSSLFQTLGINHESYGGLINVASLGLAVIIVVGNCSIPILVLAGVLKPGGG